jgi:hypothetical protein
MQDKETQETLKKELNKFKALQDVSHLEGVQLLVKHTKGIVKGCIDILSTGYAEKSEQELKVLCSTLKANLEIYQLITGAKKNIEAVEEVLSED